MKHALARIAIYSGIMLLQSLLVFAAPLLWGSPSILAADPDPPRYLAGVAAAYFASFFAWEALRPLAPIRGPLAMLLAGVLLAGAIAAWGQEIGSVGAWRAGCGIAIIVLLAPSFACLGRWSDHRTAAPGPGRRDMSGGSTG